MKRIPADKIDTHQGRLSVEVTKDAHRALCSLDWCGLPFRLRVERLLMWIGSQPKAMQAQILLCVPESMKAEFAKICLEHVTRSGSAHPDQKEDL